VFDDLPGRLIHWYLSRPLHTRTLLLLATLVLVGELAFRRFGPRSRAYKAWTKVFETIGVFWTAIILSIVYFVSVSMVALFMRLGRKDLLDRGLAPEKSYWRAHEPNPLGPKAAIRHQF
jgi:hypothetical protein